MRIKPAAGLKVRDHVTRQLLPAEGIDVVATNGMPHDPYWRERILHRDVEVVDTAPSDATGPTPEADASAHGS